MQLELNVQEAQILIHLLDLANKAAGLQVAPACIGFHTRIQKILAENQEEIIKTNE